MIAKHKFNIAGKIITTYTPKGDKKYSPHDIAEYLKKFQLNEALRLIGEISYKYIVSSNVPDQISDYILSYIAMRLIENSNDYHGHIMTLDDVLEVSDMYFGLPDPIETNKKAEECLIRFGAMQFEYNREIRNLLSRTLAIYRDLWIQDSNIDAVDIQNAIQNISGLTLEEILIFSSAFCGKSKNGFFRIYEHIDSSNKKIKDLFKRERQLLFVNWISCNYDSFRDKAKLELNEMPNSDYEKYRFNPLIKNPIIIPDCNPKPGAPQVYILPVPRLLYERVTKGLYFELSDFFRETGKCNIFRTAFGHVFQKYVGLLLENAIGQADVLGEWKYAKLSKMTPDWIILQNERAIFIEVKQSGLYKKAKTWGETDEIKKDLSRTIGLGVKQLCNFEYDIQSGKYEELKLLSNIKEVERIIVTYDRPYFLNSILRSQIWEILRKENYNIPKDYHWHTISIDEFEYLLGMPGINLFNVLKTKRLDSDNDAMDFEDYLSRQPFANTFLNPYLNKLDNEFFVKLDPGTQMNKTH